MASIDINVDYKKLQKGVESTKTYKNLKKQYDEAVKEQGSIFEKRKDAISQPLDSLSGKTKAFQKKVKSQFEHLLDVNEVTGSKSIKYIKQTLIKTVKKIEPDISKILFEECLTAVGCDQQQTFVAETPIYIKLASIDFGGLLNVDPNSKVGKLLYENKSIVIQEKKFPMNKQLYQVTQSTNSYFVDNAQFYNGESKQSLFDIRFLDVNPVTLEDGGWFEVTPKARIANINLTDVNQNLVSQFIQDYYKTIKLFDNHNVYAWLVDFLTGAISIKKNDSDAQISDKSWLAIKVQRMLGLCFDSRAEIDVSGNAKISESDGIDESFFELDSIELRQIEQKLSNIKNGVFEFESCENVKVPLNTDGVIDELEKLTYVKDNDFDKTASDLPASFSKPDVPDDKKPGFDIFDKEFVTQIINGLIGAILSPKILLPIFTMIKALGKYVDDTINSFQSFAKNFSQFVINLVSKIGALFIKALFEIIKADIKNLILSVISDITREKRDKKTKMILKLVKIFLAVAELFKLILDWRKCKSVVDELLNLIQIWQTRKDEIPFPILYTARLLDGYSETRAFIGTIEELQKIGVPTGPMPDGSPNLTVLSMFSQLKASATEENENGKVQVAIGPLTITPAGATLPSSAFGKKM